MLLYENKKIDTKQPEDRWRCIDGDGNELEICEKVAGRKMVRCRIHAIGTQVLKYSRLAGMDNIPVVKQEDEIHEDDLIITLLTYYFFALTERGLMI
jgi:hypothetical protein